MSLSGSICSTVLDDFTRMSLYFIIFFLRVWKLQLDCSIVFLKNLPTGSGASHRPEVKSLRYYLGITGWTTVVAAHSMRAGTPLHSTTLKHTHLRFSVARKDGGFKIKKCLSNKSEVWTGKWVLKPRRGQRRRGAPCPRGARGRHHRRWRCGTSCRRGRPSRRRRRSHHHR